MTQGTDKYYLHYNQVGSLRGITDTNGKLVKEISYDSYGNILSDSNSTFKIPFGFAGGLYDTDTNLTRFGYRDYDSFTGKWTTKDPIDFAGGDFNLYNYTLNDPINGFDHIGLWTFQIGGDYDIGLGFGISGSAGIAFSYSKKHGFQIGGYKSYGKGIMLGAEAGWDIDLTFSENDSICDLNGNSDTYGISVGRMRPIHIDEGYEYNIPLKKDGTRDFSLKPSHTISIGIRGGTALEAHKFKSHTKVYLWN